MGLVPRLRRVLYSFGPVLIVASHLGCLLLFWTGLGIGAALWALALYLVRMLATTAIYHRLITHTSYRAPRPVAWIGAAVAASAGQMGPSWWKAHHLAHHRHVDTAADPHTPLAPSAGWRGLWRSQAGWLLSSNFFPATLPADVEADPVLRLIDRLHFVPMLGLAGLSWQLGGLPWLAAFCLSSTLLFHGVASVNSLAHLLGDQPFATGDASRNNLFVALITLGEGWHNLHHAFQASVRQGITLDDGRPRLLLDPTYRFIRLLERLGWAWDLRIPSDRALQARAAD
ncbi:acyl-CoA desaturase [Cyanobium sp. T1B-Tous]|uniref:acyl-CoA desaturase n=1 Tax=Cyanobium sp. T1B-Tous TaxID=2823721 RepID=UPI0037BF3BEC|nr:acyl-CoA desaturase [Cyanobium sp. T1B-Tous]